jgi:hypothetical protein
MSDTLTVLTSEIGKHLSKAFRGENYDPCGFNPGSSFAVSEITVTDLETLSDALRSMETEQNQTIIRGTLVDQAPKTARRTKDVFHTKPRQWCMIDIDSLSWDGDLSDKQALLEYAIKKLPPDFHIADCWYHFSSSMGIKAGIRVHLWYWLDRPCSDNEMKTWLSSCPVDLRLFNPIQIHLTANPSFVDGAVDPYPNRSGLFEAGAGVSTVVVPSDLAFRRALSDKTSLRRAGWSRSLSV